MGPSSARRPRGHQPPQARPRSSATSRAARSTPVCPPEMILVNMRRFLPAHPGDCIMRILSLLAASLLALPAAAQKTDPSLAPIKDDPKLPRVLLIGDSISMGYTVPVRRQLEGKANVHRIPENGGPTINGLKKLDAWLGDGKWDVIHFNWGLHDLRLDKGGKHQVEIADYE